MLAARAQAIRKQKQQHPFVEEGVLLSKLMAYCSKEAHSCVEKAAMICFVKLRILEPDDKCSLRGATLQQVSLTFSSINARVYSDTRWHAQIGNELFTF
jgi:aromatic-L-amino-acid decarboxylase